MLRVRSRRSAKRELVELEDETFLRVARAILDLLEDPRPRGYDKVAGREDQRRIWVGRDHRILYEIDEKAGRIIMWGCAGSRIIMWGCAGRMNQRTSSALPINCVSTRVSSIPQYN